MPQDNGSSTWSNPATIISFLTLLLSVGTNIFQYYNSKAQIQIAKEKSDAEIKNLNAQLEHYRHLIKADDHKAETIGNANSKINTELDIVNKDIVIWEQSVLKQTIEVQSAQGELDEAQRSGNNDLVQINQEYIDKIKGTLEYSKSQLEAKKARRKELESQLQ